MKKQLAKTIGLMVIAVGNMNCAGEEQLGPATCKEAKAMYGAITDGPQTLYVDGDKSMPWAAYCAGMASDEPKEFIQLPQYTKAGAPANYSEFTEAPRKQDVPLFGDPAGFHVLTQYEKVRIDPKTLTIDITNKTFARTTVTPPDSDHTSVALEQAVGYMPYGTAMECGDERKTDEDGLPIHIPAKGNVDLTGLPFELAEVQLCNGIGPNRAIPDPEAPTKLVNFEAQGTSSDGLTCGRSSVRCLPDPAINGQVGEQGTIQLRYVTATPGFGF